MGKNMTAIKFSVSVDPENIVLSENIEQLWSISCIRNPHQEWMSIGYGLICGKQS